MRILLVTPEVVDGNGSGGSIRTNAIREALLSVGDLYTIEIHHGTRFGFDLRWSQGRGTVSIDVTATGRQRLSQAAEVKRSVRQAVALEDFDVIVVRYLSSLSYVPRSLRGRTVLDADDLIKTSGSRGPASRLTTAVRNVLAPRLAGRVRHTWVTSSRDAALVNGSARTSVLANIAPAPARAPQRDRRLPGRIVMVGFFLHGPNLQAAGWFVDQVLPALRETHPETELHLIGRGSEGAIRQGAPGVVGRGFVDDLALEYDAAAAAIAPISTGGGTQIKVIDALLHGCPLVVSPFAFEGFRDVLSPEAHVRVADTAAEWIATLRMLLDDPGPSEAMARAGHVVASRVFSPRAFDDHVRATVTESNG